MRVPPKYYYAPDVRNHWSRPRMGYVPLTANDGRHYYKKQRRNKNPILNYEYGYIVLAVFGN